MGRKRRVTFGRVLRTASVEEGCDDRQYENVTKASEMRLKYYCARFPGDRISSKWGWGWWEAEEATDDQD